MLDEFQAGSGWSVRAGARASTWPGRGPSSRVRRFAERLPGVVELDINPLIIGPGRGVAADPRIRVAPPPTGGPEPRTLRDSDMTDPSNRTRRGTRSRSSTWRAASRWTRPPGCRRRRRPGGWSATGPNRLAEAPCEPRWRAFLRQFTGPADLILLVAAVVSLVVTREWETPVVIARWCCSTRSSASSRSRGPRPRWRR